MKTIIKTKIKTVMMLTVICSFLCSCQHSPQKNYYYLSSTSVGQKELKPSTENITNIIGIGPIEIADYLNRSQIVYNQTDNTLNISENNYWAEPLDKGIARVIALNLTQQNNNRSFTNFPWRSDTKPRYSIRVQVNSLTRAANEASIFATWELMDNDTKTNLQRSNFIRTIPVESSAKDLAQAYSKLFAELAGEIDRALRKLN